ncbi:hypothetical protein [Desulfovibrio litoralis]|uniref:Uncharacterized protein n=1 Tax=Desulfovibrio litoralis DSM 11393 TaxID=1121455 RepID=A0A1M7RVD6_9BACT|nr:hypothetical protein [Desulfovibrio litoralis]SHN50134.1 hypothetical protein SAMN02745728_00208 [Desulfovibrio litoralis DSM 11393]
MQFAKILLILFGVALVSLLIWSLFNKEEIKLVPSLKNMNVSVSLPSGVMIVPTALFSPEESELITSELQKYKNFYKSMHINLDVHGAYNIRSFKEAHSPTAKASFSIIMQTKNGCILESAKVETNGRRLSGEIKNRISNGFTLYEQTVRPYSKEPANVKFISGF